MPAIPAGTKLLAHFDNNWNDSSGLAKTIANTGTIALSATQSKFGGYSANLPGTTGYWSVAHDADFNLDADFGVGCWIYTGIKTADTQFRRIWHKGDVTGAAGSIDVAMDTSGRVVVLDSSGGGSIVITGTTDISSSAFIHVELNRVGSACKLYINGTQEGSTWTTAQNFNATAVLYGMIWGGTLTTGRWNGYMDEFIWVKGAALHSANFTPETAAYGPGSIVQMSQNYNRRRRS